MSDAVRALKDKASELAAKGKSEAALETWRQVVTAAPDDLTARQKVAELLAKVGQTSAAVDAYEDLAKRFAEKGLFFKASATCRLLLGLDPRHERTLELLASPRIEVRMAALEVTIARSDLAKTAQQVDALVAPWFASRFLK